MFFFHNNQIITRYFTNIGVVKLKLDILNILDIHTLHMFQLSLFGMSQRPVRIVQGRRKGPIEISSYRFKIIQYNKP